MTDDILMRGFADPSRDSQALFRAVMNAMAQPGEVLPLPALPTAPAPLTPELASIALALCDFETPVWLDARLAASDAVPAYLRFHTAAPIVSAAEAASFAFCVEPDALPDLDRFALGTIDYPDRSTTLVIAVRTLVSGEGRRFTGPGIDGHVRFRAEPVPDRLLTQRAALARIYPRGLDIVFCAPGCVAALPRSTRMEA